MNHIVNMCPLTKFEGVLKLLYKADNDAVIWLKSTATTALTINEMCNCPQSQLQYEFV